MFSGGVIVKRGLSRLVCRIFGHAFNPDPDHEWCARCGLAYEEIVFLATGRRFYERGEAGRIILATGLIWFTCSNFGTPNGIGVCGERGSREIVIPKDLDPQRRYRIILEPAE